jgi:hypothetical protein
MAPGRFLAGGAPATVGSGRVIFACDRCGRRYSVPDEKAHGRQFRVTCRACAAVLVIRPGADGGPPSVTSVQAPAPGRQDGAPAQASPAPPAASLDVPGTAPAPAWPPPAAAPIPAARAAAPAPAPVAPAPIAPARSTPVAHGWDEPAAPPSAPPTLPEVTAPSSEVTGRRELSDAELAWLMTPPPGGVPAVSAAAQEQPVQEQPAPSGRPSSARLGLAAVVLGASVAAAVAIAGWPLRGKPTAPASPAPAVAVKPAPAPPASSPAEPQAAPAPPPTGTPIAVAAAASASTAPGPAVPVADGAAEPAADGEPVAAADGTRRRGNPRAQFEPEGISVEPVQPKRHVITRKDRQLLDLLANKQDGTAPATAEPVAVGTGGGLDQATVSRTVDEHAGAFSACLSRASKTGIAAPSHATLLVTVDPGGTVSAAWIAEAEVDRSPLGRCLSGAARRMRFAAFDGGPMEVSVPLALEGR